MDDSKNVDQYMTSNGIQEIFLHGLIFVAEAFLINFFVK